MNSNHFIQIEFTNIMMQVEVLLDRTFMFWNDLLHLILSSFIMVFESYNFHLLLIHFETMVILVSNYLISTSYLGYDFSNDEVFNLKEIYL